MFDSRRFSLCSVKNVDGKSGCKILQVSEMLYSLVSSASAAATAIIIVVLVNANSSTTHQKQWHKRKGRYKMWTLPLLHMIKSVFGVCVFVFALMRVNLCFGKCFIFIVIIFWLELRLNPEMYVHYIKTHVVAVRILFARKKWLNL